MYCILMNILYIDTQIRNTHYILNTHVYVDAAGRSGSRAAGVAVCSLKM